VECWYRYGLREALAIVNEHGLKALWARHQEMHDRLWAGLRGLGLEPFVENEDDRLVTVNTIKVWPAAW
jgi:alanine-glyoxylate transaminase/serine-glyoxylate transaminase/serine-pyruvate transaminase